MTARPVAACLAATGGSLVLVAAIVAVAGNWQDITAGIKLAGLLTIATTVIVGAERARSSLPATARAMAHLGAALVAPVVIAGSAMAGQRWPVCVLAGGALAAVACDVQARRWRAPLLDAATIIAIGLALTGVAALVPVPVGVLGAVAGCALLLARRDTAAATFALAGAASSVLVAFAEQRVGAGTLDRIGATGEVLTWSAPLAGVVAGLVLAVVATRRDAAPLAVAALAAPAIGVVTGLGTGDVNAAVWASLPGLVLVALEAVAALAPTGPWRRFSTPAADVVAAVSAAAALGAPAIVVALDAPVLPLVLAAAGLAMTTLRRSGRDGDLAAAGAGVLAVATALALESSMLGAAAVAAAVTVAAVAARRAGLLPIVASGGWGVALVLAARPADDAGASVLAVGIAFALMGAAIELRLACDARPPDVATAIVAGAGALLAASSCAAGRPAVLVAALAVAVLHVAARRPARAPALLAAATIVSGYVILPVVGDAERASIDTSFGLGLLALAAAATVTWWRAGASWTAHAATVTAVVAVPFGLAALGAGAAEVVVALIILAVVLTGWAFVTIRLTPIGSAGIAVGTVATAIASSSDDRLLLSLAVAVVGVQGALHGATRRMPGLMWSSVGLAAAGVASTWFTSGVHAAVIEWLRPYGVSAGDVAVAALAASMFAAGALARRLVACSSWVASGPGLGLVAAWLLGAELTVPPSVLRDRPDRAEFEGQNGVSWPGS